MEQSLYLFGSSLQFIPKLHYISLNEYKTYAQFDFYENDVVSFPKGSYTAIRVLSGSMYLCLDSSDKKVFLHQGSLYILSTKAAKGVLPETTSVKADVYVFSADKLLAPFKTGKTYDIRFLGGESELVSNILNCNLPYDEVNNSEADALFTYVFLLWKKLYENKDKFSGGGYDSEIKFAVDYIENNLYNKVSFSELSHELNLSERNFRKVFKEYVGVSPKTYMQKRRMRTAVSELESGQKTISEISDYLGYYSPFQFSRDFKKYFGINPSDYKKLNKENY